MSEISNTGQPAETDNGTARLIPAFTFDDFASTDKPYAWLYEQKGNPFLQQQLIQKMNAMAKAVKYSSFLGTWKKYQEVREPKQQLMGDFVTMFPEQPVQLHCGKYVADEFGVGYTGRMGEEIEVCSHPIMPVKRIINIDTNEEKLEIAYSRGGRWRSLIAGREQLASAQKVISLARNGIAVNSENAKEIVKYITELESINYEELPCQQSTGHMGWLPNGSFAPYCGDVVYDGDSGEFGRMFQDFTGHGSYQKWMEMAQTVRHGTSIPARMALAASFAAPLVSVLNALPFFVHLWGTQGCGKTVGLMLAASVWGNPEVGRYIKTFGGTKVSQELYAAFCCNVPVLLDELQVISDRRMFDDMIYMLCEGVSKGRGAREGGMQLQRRWSTCMITTGEMPIVQGNSGGGAAVRTIEVNYGGEPLFEDARAMAGALKENYGFAGKIFVDSLKSEKALEALKSIQRKYYNQLSGDIQDKQVLSASILLTADKLADAVLFKDQHYLTVEDVKPYLITREQADVNFRCYQWLLGYIAANPVRFMEDGNNGELWGMQKENVIYIIRSIFDRILQAEGYSPGAFLTWAKRNRKIIVDEQGRNSNNNRLTRRIRIGGSQVACVALIDDTEVSTLSTVENVPDGFSVANEDDDMPF